MGHYSYGPGYLYATTKSLWWVPAMGKQTLWATAVMVQATYGPLDTVMVQGTYWPLQLWSRVLMGHYSYGPGYLWATTVMVQGTYGPLQLWSRVLMGH